MSRVAVLSMLSCVWYVGAEGASDVTVTGGVLRVRLVRGTNLMVSERQLGDPFVTARGSKRHGGRHDP